MPVQLINQYKSTILIQFIGDSCRSGSCRHFSPPPCGIGLGDAGPLLLQFKRCVSLVSFLSYQCKGAGSTCTPLHSLCEDFYKDLWNHVSRQPCGIRLVVIGLHAACLMCGDKY